MQIRTPIAEFAVLSQLYGGGENLWVWQAGEVRVRRELWVSEEGVVGG